MGLKANKRKKASVESILSCFGEYLEESHFILRLKCQSKKLRILIIL